MGFQWNLEKEAANQAKHLISFRQAAEIFRGFRLTREDTRRDDGERRFIALGGVRRRGAAGGLHPARRGRSHHLSMEGEQT